MDKQYYWEKAEEAMRRANTLNLTDHDAFRNRLVTLIGLAEMNLKMMEVAPDSE